MDFLKNNKLMLIALLQSLIRWLLAVAVTKYAVTELDQGAIDQTSATLSVLLIGILSLGWSTFTHKANIDAPPPKDPPGGGSSSSRIGPTITLLALMFTAAFASVSLLGCAGQQARERVGVPALVATVDPIIDEAFAGVETWPESERDTARIDVEAFRSAIASNDLVTIQSQAYSRWPLVKSLANAGISSKLEQNLIGMNGALARRNRLAAYQDVLDSLVFGPLSGK